MKTMMKKTAQYWGVSTKFAERDRKDGQDERRYPLFPWCDYLEEVNTTDEMSLY